MRFRYTGKDPVLVMGVGLVEPNVTFESDVDWGRKRGYVRVSTQAAPPSPPPAQEAIPVPPPVPTPSPAPTPHAEETEGVDEAAWPLPDDLREMAFADALAVYRRATGKAARSWDVLIEEYRAWYTTQAPNEGGL